MKFSQTYTSIIAISFAALLAGCGEHPTKEITIEVPNLVNGATLNSAHTEGKTTPPSNALQNNK